MMQKKETLRTLFLVRTGRFELPTSCLSSKRSKPTELSPHMDRKYSINILNGQIGDGELLLLHSSEVLYIDSLHLRSSLLYGRLLEVLAGAKLTDSTGLLELPLEFLQGALDVLAFFDRNYDHN